MDNTNLYSKSNEESAEPSAAFLSKLHTRTHCTAHHSSTSPPGSSAVHDPPRIPAVPTPPASRYPTLASPGPSQACIAVVMLPDLPESTEEAGLGQRRPL